MEPLLRAKFKVNLHSLVSESKYIRIQEQKTSKTDVRQSLHQHRTKNVREELRVTNLAYAYCRGIPYSKVESKTKSPLTGSMIHRIKLKLKRKDVESIDIKKWLKT